MPRARCRCSTRRHEARRATVFVPRPRSRTRSNATSSGFTTNRSSRSRPVATVGVEALLALAASRTWPARSGRVPRTRGADRRNHPDRRVGHHGGLHAPSRRGTASAPDDQRLTLSVNLSPRQLAEANLVDTISRLLVDECIDPHDLRLSFELTETFVAVNEERERKRLVQLHDLGITLAVDDFGTGYSSLAYVKDLPVSVVKIDRSFVEGVDRDAASRSNRPWRDRARAQHRPPCRRRRGRDRRSVPRAGRARLRLRAGISPRAAEPGRAGARRSRRCACGSGARVPDRCPMSERKPSADRSKAAGRVDPTTRGARFRRPEARAPQDRPAARRRTRQTVPVQPREPVEAETGSMMAMGAAGHHQGCAATEWPHVSR